MLLRNSSLRLRNSSRHYVCPSCLSRGYTIPSFKSVRYSKSLLNGRRLALPSHADRQAFVRFPLPGTQSRHATGASVASRTSPLDPTLHPAEVRFDDPQQVREYLKKWSRDHQKSIIDNAPDRVSLERTAPLPNSLFVRGHTTSNEDEEEEAPMSSIEGLDSGMQDETMHEGSEVSVLSNRRMFPGDALRISTANGRIRQQLAVYLGTKGVQSFYLLADGRWFADCQFYFVGHVVSGLATEEELSRIEAHLPQKTIEYQKSEGATVPFSALGDIPHSDAQPILAKLAALDQEVEEAKRKFPTIFDQIYESAAHETEFVFEPLVRLLREHASVEFDTLTEGEKVFMVQTMYTDERLMPLIERSRHIVGLMPKSMARSLVQVTGWARSYQDAAARASTGKSVVEELRTNPLTGFISKSRRLISKSRKLRLPTLECELSPTLEHVRPPPGVIERKPTGEEFTTEEKTIIEFLWLVFVRKPFIQNTGAKRSASVASMIIRAVGAYPKFLLDGATGTLFLKELGCLEPWASMHDFNVAMPHPTTGLLHEYRTTKETAEAAVAALGLRRDQQQLPFADTMAHFRKDWGDLEVFCIDSSSTRIVDDGISIEPSDEFADHWWIHVHISHLSAFVPHDHPVLAQTAFLGTSMYHVFGSEPYIPYEVVTPFSLGPNKPVLTFSTLLSPDGSVKDTQVAAGTIHNVIPIEKAHFDRLYDAKIATCTLTVGKKPTIGHDETSEWWQDRQRTFERYQATFDKLKDLTRKRWEARFRDNPEHLKMLKLPLSLTSPHLDPIRFMERIEYKRLFRSEHVLGDPSISIKCKVADHDRVTYPDQSMKYNVVAGAMMLAAESAASWASERQIPLVYRFSSLGIDSTLAQLNSLGPHDFYIAPGGGESVEISKHLALNMEGYTYVTSPLRRHRDLINHYQLDAYLRAQAGSTTQLSGLSPDIQYPRTKEELLRTSEETSDGAAVTATARAERIHWTFTALYRAFYFMEAKLPEVWDVFVDNPVALKGVRRDVATTTKGSLTILGIPCEFEESQEGWENAAKFRQYVPSKIVRIEPRAKIVRVKAVGPPTDNPSVPDFAYPEFQT